MKLYPLKLSVTEDGLTAETGLAIKGFKGNWHIIYPSSHHDELPLYRRKENNVFLVKANPFQVLPGIG